MNDSSDNIKTNPNSPSQASSTSFGNLNTPRQDQVSKGTQDTYGLSSMGAVQSTSPFSEKPYEQAQQRQQAGYNQASPLSQSSSSYTQPTSSNPLSQSPAEPQSSAQPQTPLPQDQLNSPIDPPPPPTPALDPSSTVDQPPSVLTTSKKRGFPWALIFGIVAVLILGGVGFLAYQNMQLKKEVAPVAQPTPQVPLSTPPLQANPTPTTAVETTSYTSDVLPIRISLPSDWTATESENKALANQRKITAESPDFTLTGDTVSAGYQLIIGPVSDLSNKYQTFDAFAAEENADSEYQVKVVNGISWLVGENIGKTLMGQTPLTITLYAMEEDSKAAAIFDQIITSFVFTEAL